MKTTSLSLRKYKRSHLRRKKLLLLSLRTRRIFYFERSVEEVFVIDGSVIGFIEAVEEVVLEEKEGAELERTGAAECDGWM